MGIVVGSMVDGVPESAIFGIQVATGFPISIGFFAAVFVSNFPQAIAPSADLAKKGWKIGRMVGMWALVLVFCGSHPASDISSRTRSRASPEIAWRRSPAAAFLRCSPTR